MNLEDVPASLRRRFYEATSEGQALAPIFEAASPEQYLALARIERPGASDKRLLETSGIARLKQLAATADRKPLVPSPEPPLRFHLEKRPAFDVAEAVRAGHERVSLQLVKDVTNLVPPADAPVRLRALYLTSCGGQPKSSGRRLPLDELALDSCEDGLVKASLSTFEATAMSYRSPSTARWDAAGLAAQQKAAHDLHVTVARLANARALGGLPVATAHLTRVQDADDLAALVHAWRDRIEVLTLGTAVPVAPEPFSACRKLRRLRIEARAENREAWVRWAVEHAAVSVVFVTDGMITLLPKNVREVYKGVAILQKEGKATKLDIEEDIVDLLDLPFDDNSALEDALKKAAKAAKQKVSWDSEASTLVAHTADLETAHWLVDAALATKAAS